MRMEVLPSCPGRADMRASLSYVIDALAASGYVVALNLLTRAGPSSDFATDVSVRGVAKGSPLVKRRGMREIARGLLEARGLHPDAQQEAKLGACGDVDRLER
ncbi:MAG: hypothetical protein HC882_05120 [Acidobacteria bacterium]|nr:hypothetical protein [Acidobacteriota bacterium]